MLKNINFLCEIGTEEIPAGYLPSAVEAIQKSLKDQLLDNRIDFDELEVLATPRRLAIMAANLAKSQRAEEAELKGPAAKAAYDGEGKPTKALEGFMKANGVSPENLFNRDTGKGEYVFAVKKLESRQTVEILPGIVEKIVMEIPFPKRMKWSDKSLTFPRPINYFLILFDDRVVPFEIEGIVSSNKTRGHYIQANRMIEISSISEYEDILKKNHVLVNQRERRDFIDRELHAAAEKAHCRLIEDEENLNIVTFLVEYPHVVICEFDRAFLAIPDIALIAEMKEHQKYFALREADGSLSNRFLVVSNNPPTENIKIGNERVIAARFNDASFFYKEDRKVKLIDMVDTLKDVLFHKELGTIFAKVERMEKIADVVAHETGLDAAVLEKVRRAILLCKVDLNTAMVYEFSSLQGKIGRIYALSDGEDGEVADAIEEHYKPRFQGDPLPKSVVSMMVSLAEKIDNIFGSFSVGNIPKGSADPYALRRQANAVVDLLIGGSIDISLRDVLEKIAPQYKNGKDLVEQILDFIMARAKTIFSENGFRYDEIDACLSIGSSNYLELFRRAKSINEFRKNENFSRMLLSFKRMNNIVSGFRKENTDYKLSFKASLLEEKEEKELHEFFDSRKDQISRYIAESSYIALFELLIQGKAIIDGFFDKVLVMDKRIDVRDNRLYLLENILGNFSSLLDFSKISDK
ncbi:MAG: glycine--tRNA ligase subunit beta [Spirochaetae bacterium HGW-Spirochaetae-1]|jgi:glycyl-tRNA synthetase beta chain|nr:MAG: glycine--tRNA ligase subunit beta [Spirochaetae bacterium HGW-Spirochaetae-1]